MPFHHFLFFEVKMLEPAVSTSYDMQWEIIIHGSVFQEALKPHKCVFLYSLSVNVGSRAPTDLQVSRSLYLLHAVVSNSKLSNNFLLVAFHVGISWSGTAGLVMSVLLHCWSEIDSACGIIVLLYDKFSHSVLAK
jgi:hypothetical protein